jgi:hypothetical protein
MPTMAQEAFAIINQDDHPGVKRDGYFYNILMATHQEEFESWFQVGNEFIFCFEDGSRLVAVEQNSLYEDWPITAI